MRVFANIVALLAASVSLAQTVPPAAYGYQHLHRQQVQSVWGLDAPVASLAAQVHQESGWNCAARSWVGAQGCAQFMPATAADMGKRYPAALYPPNPHNPRWAFRAQAQYMRDLYLGRGASGAANDCERFAFALAGYNGGEGWTRKRQRLSPTPLACLYATCEINPGILPANQRENAAYPKRILLTLEPAYVAAGFGIGACTR